MARKIEGKGVINWRITMVILFIIFVQNMISALLYADSPFLIESYFPDIEKKKIGHYAGYLISMYNLGQIPGCLYWGWSADRTGRKSALIVITLLVSICMIVFGFCTNFYVAITTRFIWGIFDGYLGICKTVLSEICSEDMLPITTGCMFISMALSSVLGPIVGGYLSEPEVIFKDLIKYFPHLLRVPFAIPLLVCGLMCLLCCLMTYLWVDETLPEEDIIKNKQKKESTTVSDPSENTGYFAMLRNWLVVVTVSLYALEGVIQGTYDTVLPIWLASDESVGGFELNKKDLGWVLSFVSPMQMATLLILPVITKLCGTRRSYILLSTIQVFILGLNPVVSTLNTIPYENQIVLLYCVISSFHVIRSVLFNTAVYVLIANSCYQEFRAKAYCLSQVLAGFLRFFGPTFIPILFAWSIEKPRPFPFNYGLSMYILALLTVVCVVMTWILPKSIDEGKGSMHDVKEEKNEMNVPLINEA